MSSPLNKLADALPNFILQMQDIKMRQEYYEARSEYQARMLTEQIETNRLERKAEEAIKILRETERGQEVRGKIFKAIKDYGSEAARAQYPVASEKYFPRLEGGYPTLKEEEKKPSAQNIAWARKRQGVFQKEITDIEGRIAQMRQEQGIAPGGKPKKAEGFGKKKEQIFINNWDKAHKDLENVKTSLDSLRQDSEKKGIDLRYGARTSPQTELPNPTELLEGQTGTDSAGVSWIIRNGQWEENK